MSLASRLRNQIEAHGPITVADYMTLALYDPEEGYYATKVPIGRAGDYITAPEMTQVFGEVIALWLVDIWQKAGSPTPFHLVEMGPGRGTLMADMLRTLQSLKMPLSDMTVHLVEVSPLLIKVQKETISPYSASLFWHKNLTTLPKDQGFCLMVANEFWDALPIQQYVRINNDWIERKIGLQGEQFVFLPEDSTNIRETCPMMPSLALQISEHLKQTTGVALFIDYGYDQANALGDTLQALYHHQRQSPLENSGKADLTHHVDFHRLSCLFKGADLTVHGPIAQGDFLKAIGLEIRTEQLCELANPKQRGALQTAAMRLTHPSQMGRLFKVISVTSDPALHPSGF